MNEKTYHISQKQLAEAEAFTARIYSESVLKTVWRRIRKPSRKTILRFRRHRILPFFVLRNSRCRMATVTSASLTRPRAMQSQMRIHQQLETWRLVTATPHMFPA